MEDIDDSRLWRITPKGEVAPIPLHGVRMSTAGHIIASGDGNYLIGSGGDHAVFRMTPAGEITKFADLSGYRNLTGLVRNPQTGEVVGTLNFDKALIRISADGQGVGALVTDARYLQYPTAVLAESEE